MSEVDFLADVRNLFPIFRIENPATCIYFDTAATSQKPQEVIDAMNLYFSQECGTVHRAIYSLAREVTAKYDETRELVKDFIGASESSEIVFTKGTTDGINLVASSYGRSFLSEGDEILITETEHHSNIVPWQMLSLEKGAVLKIIPVDDQGEIIVEQFVKMLSSKVKLVSIAYIANATGVIHPIHEVIRISHQHGAKVLVDAAQAASHMPIDVQALDVDFLVFSGHKIYGPTGVGILYGKKELLEKMPPYQGGGDMIRSVTFEKTTYQEPPLRFEAGTPNISGVMGLHAAICFIQKVGVARIEAHEKLLTGYALRALEKVPAVKLLSQPKHRSSIISFNCEGCHPLDVGTLLDTRGIAVRTGHLCAQPALKRLGVTSTIRVSFGMYNTTQEIDVFIQSLKDVLSILTA